MWKLLRIGKLQLSKVTYNPAISRRETAVGSKKSKIAPYRIIEDGADAVFLSGEYSGKKVSDVWAASEEGRDYLFSQVYKTDPDMRVIIERLCCK